MVVYAWAWATGGRGTGRGRSLEWGTGMGSRKVEEKDQAKEYAAMTQRCLNSRFSILRLDHRESTDTDTEPDPDPATHTHILVRAAKMERLPRRASLNLPVWFVHHSVTGSRMETVSSSSCSIAYCHAFSKSVS